MRLHDVPERTTLTLDDDVAAEIRAAARARGLPVRVVVNEAIRAGLQNPIEHSEPFRVVPREMGLRPGIDLDDIEGLVALLEQTPAR
jgi:hypothetical protein